MLHIHPTFKNNPNAIDGQHAAGFLESFLDVVLYATPEWIAKMNRFWLELDMAF